MTFLSKMYHLQVYVDFTMQYIIGAILISSLAFFMVVLLINATGLTLSQNLLSYGWVIWGVLTILFYPLAKKIMV